MPSALAAEQEEQQQRKEFAESASNQQIEGADHQDEQQREDAAVKIQKLHRGNAGRQQVSEVRVLQEKKSEAATKIQSLEEVGNAVSNLLQSKRSSNSKKCLQEVLQISR